MQTSRAGFVSVGDISDLVNTADIRQEAKDNIHRLIHVNLSRGDQVVSVKDFLEFFFSLQLDMCKTSQGMREYVRLLGALSRMEIWSSADDSKEEKYQ